MAERKLARAAPRIAAQLLLGLGVLAITTAPSLGQDFLLTRLVDDRMVLPGGSPAFGSIEDFALDAAGNLAFTSGGRAFAIVDGSLHGLSDPTVPVDRVEIDDGRVFWSERAEDGDDAILGWEAGVSSVVVDEDTQVPGTECLFRGGLGGFAEGWRRIDASIVFHGASDDPGCEEVEGTYRWKDGGIEVLADRRTAIEDGGALRHCRFEDLWRHRVLLLCASPGEGSWLYTTEPNGSHRRIAGPGLELSPGGTVLSAVLRNDVIAYLGHDASSGSRTGARDELELHVRTLGGGTFQGPSAGDGVTWTYRFDGRHIALHVSPPPRRGPSVVIRTASPNGSTYEIDLGGLGPPVQEVALGEFVDDWLPFTISFDDGSSAVHAARSDGALVRILGPGDAVDGRIVRSAAIGRSAGRSLAVSVDFTDGCASCAGSWDGIYAAELEPPPVEIPLVEGVELIPLIDERTRLPDGSRALDQFDWRLSVAGSRFSLDRSGNFAFFSTSRVFAGIGGEIHEVGRLSEAEQDDDVEVNHVEIEAEDVFWSKEVSDERGGGVLYHWKGGTTTVVADEDTPIPGTRCTFWGGEGGVGDNWEPVGDGGVSLPARSETGWPECDDEVLRGRYLWRDGAIQEMPSSPPIVIEDGGQRLECHLLQLDGDRSLRWCSVPGTQYLLGYYLFGLDGKYTRIAGYGDPVPGAFAMLGWPLLRDGRFAFIAYTYEGDVWPYAWRQGVYAWDGVSLRTVATSETMGLDPSFASSVEWRLFFDGRHVAVHLPRQNFDLGPILHLARLNGSEGKTIDLGVIHGHDGDLDVQGLRTFMGGWLPFTASRFDSPISAVYAARADGSLFRILGPGDVLDGRLVLSAAFAYTSLPRGSMLSLHVSFSPRAVGREAPLDAIYALRLPPTEVAIDVRPGSRRNRIQPARRELVPVALLGSPELDVTDVDPARLAFGPDGAMPWRGRVARRDVNSDGFGDLVAHFRQRDTGIARGDEEACLSGETTDGVAFEGCDAVRTPRRASAR